VPNVILMMICEKTMAFQATATPDTDISRLVPCIPGPTAAPPSRGGDILAPGFAMTVGAWIVAYLSFIPILPKHMPGQATVSIMLAVVFFGGFLTGRYSCRGVLAALLAGILSGALDILIVGSVFYDLAGPEGLGRTALLLTGGSILLNGLVAALGGVFGMLLPSRRRGQICWGAVFALVLAAATLPLITAGGLVVAYGAGMSVPDWPLSFGNDMFLYRLSQMQAQPGTFYEHTHRLMGTLVGLTSLTLAIYMSIASRRTRLAAIAWVIFVAVCIQGVLGGLRVTENSILLATIHGIFAQIVFASMACLAVAATGAFVAVPPRMPGSMDRLASATLVVALLVQLAFGALVRQRFDSLVLIHITFAGVLAILALVCGFRAYFRGTALGGEPLISVGIFILSAVACQLLLGAIALMLRPATATSPKTTVSALWTTAHQANGAILLALAAVLWLWNWRLFSAKAELNSG
jgi:cytochrome c oxidase assembly protein subunit 15